MPACVDIQNYPKVSGFFRRPLRSDSWFGGVQPVLRGRDALELLLKKLDLTGKGVLVPALCCNSVHRVLRLSCQVQYYDLNADYSLNLQEIDRLLDQHDFTAFFLVHYFGQIHQQLAEIKKICHARDVLLIEDFAHAGLSSFPVDSIDAAIFSYRKLLPIVDGGGCYLRSQPQVCVFNNSDQIKALSFSIMAWFKAALSLRSSRFRRWISKRLRERENMVSVSFNNAPACRGRKILPHSAISRYLVRRIDINWVMEQRRSNFKLIEELLGDRVPARFPQSINEGCVPYAYNLYAENCRELQLRLKNKGILAKRHWPDIDPLILEKFPGAKYLALNTLALPVHEGIGEEIIRLMCRTITEHLRPIEERSNHEL